MRIGIFTEVYKPVINGVVNSIINFKKGLEKLGHEVYIFCPKYRNYKPDKNVIYCNSFPLPEKIGYHYIYPFDASVKKIAKKLDIIHVQHPFVMGDRAADLSREFNIPIAFTNHTQYDQYTHYVPFLSKKFVIRQIVNYIKKFSSRVNLIVAPAKGIKRKLISYKIKTPIQIVPNGINVDRFSKTVSEQDIDNIRKNYNIPAKNKILIFTGRIAEEKNLTFLIKSFKKVLSKKHNLTLLMVGGGVEIDKFKDLVKKLKLTKNAIITDFIPYQEMHKYLHSAYFYITASKSEVHPLTILEGMAAGLPMVIVKAPGTGDIVTNEKDGLISEDDINKYSKNILKLLEDKKLHDKLSLGAKKTSKQYSILETSKKMLKAYKKTIFIRKNK